MDKFYGGLLRFCPKCGTHMADRDLHPDESQRWLRCKMCGYCERKLPLSQENGKNETPQED